jgi:adenylate cyclase
MTLMATVFFAEVTDVTQVSFLTAREPPAFTPLKTELALQIEHFGAHLFKILGNGVLAVFLAPQEALICASSLIQDMQYRAPGSDLEPCFALKIGLCTGAIDIVGGDCFGDAVNVAFRLSQMATVNEILADLSSADLPHLPQSLHHENLGPIPIRGRAELSCVLKFTPIENSSPDQSTELADFHPPFDALLEGEPFIDLNHDQHFQRYSRAKLPIRIGRGQDVEFHLSDERVSRTHVIIEWRQSGPSVLDVSSFGTWVRFDGGEAFFLRREFCTLHGRGELILSSTFATKDAPSVRFEIIQA